MMKPMERVMRAYVKHQAEVADSGGLAEDEDCELCFVFVMAMAGAQAVKIE